MGIPEIIVGIIAVVVGLTIAWLLWEKYTEPEMGLVKIGEGCPVCGNLEVDVWQLDGEMLISRCFNCWDKQDEEAKVQFEDITNDQSSSIR
jgi:hypothetical protein